MIELLELLFLLVLVIVGTPVFFISGVMIINLISEKIAIGNEFKYNRRKKEKNGLGGYNIFLALLTFSFIFFRM